MPRLTEQERLERLDAHENHWQEANASKGPLELGAGYGIEQFKQQAHQYKEKVAQITRLVEGELPQLRAERDALFGLSSEDEQSVRLRLSKYKPLVRTLIGTRHPLSKTIPNMGQLVPSEYTNTIGRFADHWQRVNSTSSLPLVIGGYTLLDLQRDHETLLQKGRTIETLTHSVLPLLRAEREAMYGDVSEEERGTESLVTRMLQYQTEVQARWPNQPIAKTLPRLFPEQSAAKLPAFAFNWAAQADQVVKMWFTMPALAKASSLYLKEGEIERSVSLDGKAAGKTYTLLWDALTIIDDLDELEIQDANGSTLAIGQYMASLPLP